jgi:hypothetical protein
MHGSRSFYATACCSAVLAVACARSMGDAAREATDAPATTAASSVSPADSTARTADAAAAPSPFALPVRARSIGHTSYVLKLTFEDGGAAVFKPKSKLALGDRRYKGEIAAYRLARALGLENVRTAIPGAFDAGKLRAIADGFDAKAIVDADGRVRGSLVPWLETYRTLPLEDEAWRKRWEPWLFDRRATVPEPERTRAASISTMLAFDYVTANWDRWSGGNVAEDTATGRVLFVDNDGAFYDPPDGAALERQLGTLRRILRFSRSFVAALRGLDAAKLATAIGDELPGTPLLPQRVLDGLDARRRTVLQVVDARSADAGEGATLAFE